VVDQDSYQNAIIWEHTDKATGRVTMVKIEPEEYHASINHSQVLFSVRQSISNFCSTWVYLGYATETDLKEGTIRIIPYSGLPGAACEHF